MRKIKITFVFVLTFCVLSGMEELYKYLRKANFKVNIHPASGFDSTEQPNSRQHTDGSREHLHPDDQSGFKTFRLETEADPMRMSKRMSEIREVCNAKPDWTNYNMQGEVYIIKSSSVRAPVAYCEVPKVGCTFWKRVLRFINHDYGIPNITSPNEISRLYTHMTPLTNTAKLSLTNEKDFQIFQKIPRKFMFSRDPYTRQWSAYLDKFFLPDFWGAYGKTASMVFRKRPTCGDDVSFEEYLRYIFGWIKTCDFNSVKNTKCPAGAVPVDRHFLQISDVCNPCKANFSFIGQLETFVSDSRQIMEDFNMLSNKDSLFQDVTKNEIISLSEYYLELAHFRSRNEPSCYNSTLVARRLWRVFQINGYLGNELNFPESQVSNCTNLKSCKELFVSVVFKARDLGSANHSVWEKQRKQSLVDAYRQLPEDLLQSFREIYAKDFELFGYDSKPDYIFT